MPRNDQGDLTSIDLNDVVNAVVEAISFDAATAVEAGGSGVFHHNPIFDREGNLLVLDANDHSKYAVTIIPLLEGTT